ncbi:hypothetical protein BOTU111921_11690 [Bordetella tumbae]|uniref:ankyrin repeat domain-containing protein n=1 Tax=Bordetella tumbae TaxID=1649139 RepID=UPI0039EDEF77
METLQSSISQTAPSMPSIDTPPAPEMITDGAFHAAETGDIDALVHLLDEYQFDLTTIDEREGQTVLHQAIAGGHDAMVKMLLGRAGNDPQILDAKDRDGYTPLMRATEKGNVALMQALIDVGARTDDSVALGSLAKKGGNYESPAKQATITALMLIEARGDISEAFALAMEHRSRYAAKLFFDAGASTLPAMQRLPFRDVIHQLVLREHIRADDVFVVLDQAERAGKNDVLKRLAQHDMVCLMLDDMQSRSDDEKIKTLKRLMAVPGAEPERWLGGGAILYKKGVTPNEQEWAALFKSPRFERVRLLIAVGLDSRELLVHHCVWEGGEKLLQKLIEWGGDVVGALQILRQRSARCFASWPAANLLAYVELKNILQADGISEEEKRSALKAVVLEGAEPAASALLRDMAKTSKSLDEVKLLLSVGASPTEALMDLGRFNYRATVQQFIRLGIDFFPAMHALLDNGEQEAANVLALAAALEHAPPGPGNPAKS